jgi:dipeptidyl-peptidase-4
MHITNLFKSIKANFPFKKWGIACLMLLAFARGSVAQKWLPDGTSYYANEKNVIVKYQLPAFTRTELVTASQLTPAGQSAPLNVRDFEFSADGKSLLIYTNSKRVWRRDTRGDYWVLNLATNQLRQLGKGMPASSLMFAKFSPDSKSVAYVSGHNIYTEDLATGAIKALTTNGTDRMINGTFDWVYEEEFSCRDGFRWSPDSKHIAYWQIDATQQYRFSVFVHRTG